MVFPAGADAAYLIGRFVLREFAFCAVMTVLATLVEPISRIAADPDNSGTIGTAR
jgi:hypothetical protein